MTDAVFLMKPEYYDLVINMTFVTDAPFAFIFEVVIIRCDKMARDRGIAHMIMARTNIT